MELHDEADERPSKRTRLENGEEQKELSSPDDRAARGQEAGDEDNSASMASADSGELRPDLVVQGSKHSAADARGTAGARKLPIKMRQDEHDTGAVSSGMGALPRPPPLTIPGEAHVLGTNFSPLPNLLGSPYLDLMSASPNTQLMAMFQQMAQQTGRTGVTPINILADGSTPGLLLSPNLWPDTMRSNGGLRSLMDFQDIQAMEDLEDTALGNIADEAVAAVGSKAGSGAGKSKGNSAADALLQLSSPTVSPAGMSLYKGVHYDKERNVWQVVLWDGTRFNVLGEYPNELEALVANELLSPAQPLSTLQASALAGLGGSYMSGARTPTLQEYLARLSAGVLLTQSACVSPASNALSPLGGSTSPLGSIQALLLGAPTPLGGLAPSVHEHKMTTSYKGVRWNREHRKWQGYVLDGDRVHWLGLYEDEEEAARAHDAEALRRFGANADVNFTTNAETPLGAASHHSSRGGGGGGRPPRVEQSSGSAIKAGPGRPGRPRKIDKPPQRESSPEMPVLPITISSRGRGRRPSAIAVAAAQTAALEAKEAAAASANHHSHHHNHHNQPHSAGPDIRLHSEPKRTTQFRGVSWSEADNKWQAQFFDGTKSHSLGLFDNAEEAARAFDIAVVKSGRKERLNFPATNYRNPPQAIDGSMAVPPMIAPPPVTKSVRNSSNASGGGSAKVTSQYKGVSWNSACSKWVAVLWDRELKRARHIGSFESEEDAARAYDREAIKMLGPDAGLNFRESAADYLAQAGGAVSIPEGGGSNKGSSQYRGVSWHERSQRWEVRVWGGGKQHFIGSFTSEIEAARAYDKAVLRLRGQDARSRSRMNFPVTDYNLEEIGMEPLAKMEPRSEERPGPASRTGAARRSVRKHRKRKDDAVGGESDMEDLDEDLDDYGTPSHVQHQLPTNSAAAALAAAAASVPGLLPPLHLGHPPPFGHVKPHHPLYPGRKMDLLDGPSSGRAAFEAAALMPSIMAGLPNPSIYYDEVQRKWVASLIINGTSTYLGSCDTEAEAQLIAGQGMVAALAAIMGQAGLDAAPTHQQQPFMPMPGGKTLPVIDLSLPASSSPSPNIGPVGALMLAAQQGRVPPSAALAAARRLKADGGHSSGNDSDHAVQALQALQGAGRQLQQQQGAAGSGDDDTDMEESFGQATQGTGTAGAIADDAVAAGGQPTGRGKSQYRGVSWCEKVKKWRALLWDGQRQRFLGHYATDLDAARAYDRALLELKGQEAKTNFPAVEYENAPPPEDVAGRRAPTSQYKGVSYNKHSGKWESRLRQGGRNLYLGSFDAEIDAARSYDCAAMHLRGPTATTNFPPEIYTEQERQEAANRLSNCLSTGGEDGEGRRTRKVVDRGGNNSSGAVPDASGMAAAAGMVAPTSADLLGAGGLAAATALLTGNAAPQVHYFAAAQNQLWSEADLMGKHKLDVRSFRGRPGIKLGSGSDALLKLLGEAAALSAMQDDERLRDQSTTATAAAATATSPSSTSTAAASHKHIAAGPGGHNGTIPYPASYDDTEDPHASAIGWDLFCAHYSAGGKDAPTSNIAEVVSPTESPGTIALKALFEVNAQAAAMQLRSQAQARSPSFSFPRNLGSTELQAADSPQLCSEQPSSAAAAAAAAAPAAASASTDTAHEEVQDQDNKASDGYGSAGAAGAEAAAPQQQQQQQQRLDSVHTAADAAADLHLQDVASIEQHHK